MKWLEFCNILDDLFDVAPQNALQMISIKKDKQFLMKQPQEENQKILSSGKPKKRARIDLMTTRLAAALDKCKISERDTVHLILAFMEAVSIDPTPHIINKTSIRKPV